MIQVLAAAVLALHGLIHLIGFVVPWKVAVLADYPYRTTLLNDAIAVGETGARLIGIAWLGLAVAFAVAALATLRGAAWAPGLTAAAAAVSLIVCVLGLPEAAAGIAVNIAILAAVAFVLRGAAVGLQG